MTRNSGSVTAMGVAWAVLSAGMMLALLTVSIIGVSYLLEKLYGMHQYLATSTATAVGFTLIAVPLTVPIVWGPWAYLTSKRKTEVVIFAMSNAMFWFLWLLVQIFGEPGPDIVIAVAMFPLSILLPQILNWGADNDA